MEFFEDEFGKSTSRVLLLNTADQEETFKFKTNAACLGLEFYVQPPSGTLGPKGRAEVTAVLEGFVPDTLFSRLRVAVEVSGGGTWIKLPCSRVARQEAGMTSFVTGPPPTTTVMDQASTLSEEPFCPHQQQQQLPRGPRIHSLGRGSTHRWKKHARRRKGTKRSRQEFLGGSDYALVQLGIVPYLVSVALWMAVGAALGISLLCPSRTDGNLSAYK